MAPAHPVNPTLKPKSIVEPTAQEVAAWVGGTLLDVQTAPPKLTGLGTLEEAEASEISFVAGGKHMKAARVCVAGLMLVPKGTDLPGRARIEVENVWRAVTEIMLRFYPDPVPPAGIHATAIMGRDVTLGKDVSIGAYCVLGDFVELEDGVVLGAHCSIDAGCKIGAGSRFHSQVVLQGRVRVGRNVILHPGVVLGADGFRYEAGPTGILKIPQIGFVVIEDEVEIGANTTVDRPFLYETRIGRGTKIDNQVQVGHNCNIGRYCIIAGCCAIAGSVTLEDGCIVGGGASFRESITIGKGSMVGGMSAVDKSFPPGSIVMGYPARPHREFLRNQAQIQRVPKLLQRIEALEAKLGIKPDKSTSAE